MAAKTTAYQVSAPAFTCLVVVDEHGRICDTAPYLRRQWLRRPWNMFQAVLWQRYGERMRIHTLAGKD